MDRGQLKSQSNGDRRQTLASVPEAMQVILLVHRRLSNPSKHSITPIRYFGREAHVLPKDQGLISSITTGPVWVTGVVDAVAIALADALEDPYCCSSRAADVLVNRSNTAAKHAMMQYMAAFQNSTCRFKIAHLNT